jgi:hypothetical protein
LKKIDMRGKMTEIDHGADLRAGSPRRSKRAIGAPSVPTTRAILERHLGADLWRHASYLDGMARAAEREREFHEAASVQAKSGQEAA